MDDNNSRALLNEQEAAARLNCSVALLRKWRGQGEGPPYCKLGERLVRYAPEALDAFISAHTEVRNV